MPTLDWLNRDAAFRTADQVPYRLLQAVSTHGDGDARNLLVQGDNLQALKALAPLAGPRVVYGQACRLGAARLAAEGISFRQIPYELAAR